MNPNLELHLDRTEAGLYTVTFGYKEAPLNVQEAAFAAHGLDTVSPAQLGFLRATQPAGVSTFNPYSRTSADIFYDDRSDRAVIVPNGAISHRLVGIVQLVDAHWQGRPYVLPENQLEVVYSMIDEMLRNGLAVTSNRRQTEVPTSKFGSTELTSKLFSDAKLGIKAQDYGDWLQNQGRKVQSLLLEEKEYARSQDGPFVNRLQVFGRLGKFDVCGCYCDLGNGGPFSSGAFGARFERTAESEERK